MPFLSKLTAGALVAASLLLPGEALADRSRMSPSFAAHYDLAVAAEEVGIDFLLNPPACDSERNTYGWYYAGGKQLVVCQVNKVKGSTQEMEWTPEDLDTLRHEIHHLVQDCVDGRIDGDLDAVYVDSEGVIEHVLSPFKIKRIIKAYADTGSYHTMMELEAFAVADMNDPVEQLADIRTYCM